MKVNLDAMTKAELRAYVVSHPDDKEAFNVFVDKFTSNSSSPIFSLPQTEAEMREVEQLIYQKVAQNNTKN